MTMSRKYAIAARSVTAFALLAALGGCATTSNTKQPGAQAYSAIYERAEADVSAGRVDAALTGFSDAGKADPSRKEPWVRTAQLQFDKGNYARAILASEEVLQRDPTDLVADSVLTVSGFRIANQSLNRLKGNGALASDTARTEAELLVSTLKSTMGEDIVGGPPPRTAAPARRTGRAGPARRPTVPGAPPTADTSMPAAPAMPATAPAPPPPAKPSSDPFKNIGGN